MRIALGALVLVTAIVIGGGALGGCVGDGRRERAYQSVEMAAHALDLVDQTSGSEALDETTRDALAQARASAREWASHAHQALETWRNDESRSLAFETAIPCLGRSLGTLRERLAEHHRPIPESLRQAEALARTASEMRCARRRRSRAPHDDADERQAGAPREEPASRGGHDEVARGGDEPE